MAELQIKIELRDHIGKRHVDGIEVEVSHDQWIVVGSLNDNPPKQWGYMRKVAGAPLLPLATLWERYGILRDKIEAAVAEARDAKLAEVPA